MLKPINSILTKTWLSLLALLLLTLALLAYTFRESSSTMLNQAVSFMATPPLLLEIPFKHRIIDDQPNTGPDCCTDVAALGDMNGDGYLDVVIGSEHAEADGLVWYQYPDWSRHAIGDGDFTTDGETADLDRDGDVDVVVSSISRNVMEWWENSGDPTVKANWKRHEIGAGFAHDTALGDLNGDGHLDVVVKRKGGDNFLAWFAAPEAPTQAWTEHQIAAFAGEGLDIGDIDGDGDLDLAISRYWYENQTGNGNQWRQHSVTAVWGEDTRTIISDMNGDGKDDIVLSHAEGQGRVAWFENPSWMEHTIEADNLIGAHSLAVADFDQDGAPDLFTGEMHTSWFKRVLLYQNLGDGATWRKITLANTGTHNAQVGDIDQDGDVDVVGKNYGGSDRVIEWWENFSEEAGSLQHWAYIPLDEKRPESQMGKMGLVFTDVNQDHWTDIVAGSYLYLNPGGEVRSRWRRTELPNQIDIYFAAAVDNDQYSDLIGIRGATIEWLEAADKEGRVWNAHPIGLAPEGRTQGYTLAQITPGGKPEMVFTRAKNLYYLEIPVADPAKGEWPLIQVAATNEEEGVAAGDIDLDGDIDLAAQAADGYHTVWFENPGNGSGDWAKHPVGPSSQWLDRIALADLNTDGRLDIIVTEETQDRFYNAHIYWFEAPVDPHTDQWSRHVIDTLRSVNSLAVADMDGDGDSDIVAAEHTDISRGRLQSRLQPVAQPDNLTVWYENQQNGRRWLPHAVEIGDHSSHLGVQVHDLDNDGDLDIVSIAWRQYKSLHLWQNLIKNRPAIPPL